MGNHNSGRKPGFNVRVPDDSILNRKPFKSGDEVGERLIRGTDAARLLGASMNAFNRWRARGQVVPAFEINGIACGYRVRDLQAFALKHLKST